ncbi:hypothetical protein RHSIM_Rhsim10G0145100 [Rhododendron simsii]|uniref:Palmitoyltransferase n=1 Tax=Rhododendron simsii TaxID=118357 RepID=A0A834GCW3_RHOSS|nr:hypothetical protein RHSIM_Rhsim10G0145100 [Rhododendron simsii]
MKFLMDEHETVWKAMKKSPASMILMAYCFISLWFVGGLTGFHLYLIGTNQDNGGCDGSFVCLALRLLVSILAVSWTADNRPNVYNRGCLNNFLELFCTKIEPSRNNFCAYGQEEAPRLPRAPPREAEVDDSSRSRRAKVEDDLEMGDVLKISQCH